MNTSKTLTATYSGADLSEYANACNNGNTQDVSFYVNGNTVIVGYRCSAMSEQEQIENLKWFCGSNLISIV